MDVKGYKTECITCLTKCIFISLTSDYNFALNPVTTSNSSSAVIGLRKNEFCKLTLLKK